MNKSEISLIFMGTPEFALSALETLFDDGYNIISVYSTPDKPRGRGHKMTPTVVKEFAISKSIPVFTPVTLRDENVINEIAEQKPDFIVVAAYGKILPAAVLEIPKYGCINIHGSLLPKYRGAAPIQRAIVDGEEKTGVTIMKMDEGLDTGDMLAKSEVPILPDDNFETVHDSLAKAGAELISETLLKYAAGEIIPEKQDERGSCYAGKITQSDRTLDFNGNAKDIINRIRGLSPVPLTIVMHRGKLLKITAVQSAVYDKRGRCGEVTELGSKGNGYIEVACGDGDIRITEVIPEGKGKQSAGDFIRGRRIEINDIFEKAED